MIPTIIKNTLLSGTILSASFTSLHYGSNAYLKAENTIREYALSKIYKIKASLLSYTGLSEVDTTPKIPENQLITLSRINGLNPNLIKAIIEQESGYNTTAERFEPKIKDGSIGLMQVLSSWAGSPICPKIHWSDLFKETPNLECGIAVLKHASLPTKNKTTKTLRETLRSYNSSPQCELKPECKNRADLYASKVIEKFAELQFKNP